MTMEYNVEKLKEIYKKALLFSVQARMLKQDLTQNNRAFMKGMLKAKIKNVGKLLGWDYFLDWRNQNGEILDISLYSLFRIKRTINDITLTDEKFKLLGNFASISAITNISIFMNLINGLSLFKGKLYACLDRQKENNILRIYVKGDILDNIFVFIRYYKLINMPIGTITTFTKIPEDKQILLMPDGEMDYSNEYQQNLVFLRYIFFVLFVQHQLFL